MKNIVGKFILLLKSVTKCLFLTICVVTFLMFSMIIDVQNSGVVLIFLVLGIFCIIRLPKSKFIRYYYSVLFILAGLFSFVVYMTPQKLIGISILYFVMSIVFIVLGVFYLRDRSIPIFSCVCQNTPRSAKMIVSRIRGFLINLDC